MSRADSADIVALKKFYNVTSNRDLIAAMLRHIEKLQDAKKDSLEWALRHIRS